MLSINSKLPELFIAIAVKLLIICLVHTQLSELTIYLTGLTVHILGSNRYT